MGTLFGSAGLKMVEHWLGRARTRAADAATIREELRKEIDGLRVQLEKADAEEKRLEGLLDDWKNQYYDLRDEKQKVVTELAIITERLKVLEATPSKRSDNSSSN